MVRFDKIQYFSFSPRSNVCFKISPRDGVREYWDKTKSEKYEWKREFSLDRKIFTKGFAILLVDCLHKLLRKTRIDKLDALKGKQREALYQGKFIREFLTYWLFLFTLIKVYGVSSSNRFHLFTIPAVNRHFFEESIVRTRIHYSHNRPFFRIFFFSYAHKFPCNFSKFIICICAN